MKPSLRTFALVSLGTLKSVCGNVVKIFDASNLDIAADIQLTGQCAPVQPLADALGGNIPAAAYCLSFLATSTIRITASTNYVTSTVATLTQIAEPIASTQTITTSITTCKLAAKRDLNTGPRPLPPSFPAVLPFPPIPSSQSSPLSFAPFISFPPLSSSQPRTPSITPIISLPPVSSSQRPPFSLTPISLPPVQVSTIGSLSDQDCEAISSLCSCLCVATPSIRSRTTEIVTPTVVVPVTVQMIITPTSSEIITATLTSVVCPTPTDCGNRGLQWAEYPNGQGANGDNTYSQLDPTVYKNQSPNAQGITFSADVNVNGDQQISVYGSSTTFNSAYFVLDHRGYLFAPESGAYIINVSNVDDGFFLWYGPTAYSGWSRANANLFLSFQFSGAVTGPSSGSITINMIEGEYLPIRMMFVQGQLATASFQVSITAPDGTVFLSPNTQSSPYLVQYSCDGLLAPPYPDFGSET
ncbi:GLEYA domain-containing protein [Xylariales sp. PMI_506]|nr:GLEYA domain-containing protein [Xylariales sp. PMI_506]